MQFSAESTMNEGVSLLETIAGKDRTKRALNEAARRISAFLKPPILQSRVYDIWRGESVAKAHELLAMRAAAGMAQEARDGIAELRARIARIEATMAVQDEDFSQPHVDALRSASNRFGGQDRPLDRTGAVGRPSGLEGGE